MFRYDKKLIDFQFMEVVSKRNAGDNLREAILGTIKEVVNPAELIKSGDHVFLKPNFNTADPFPASSDIDFLKAVIEIVYDFGAGKVTLGDACTFSQNNDTVLHMKKAYELEKIGKCTKVIDFTKSSWVRKPVPNGKYLKSISLPSILDEVDRLILLPCMKTHSWAQFTGSLKLSVGFMKPSERLMFHAHKMQEKIAEINTLISPDLVIMDGRKCFITKGPSEGEEREPNVILASKRRAALDIAAVKIIKSYPQNALSNVDPLEIQQIAHALELGIE